MLRSSTAMSRTLRGRIANVDVAAQRIRAGLNHLLNLYAQGSHEFRDLTKVVVRERHSSTLFSTLFTRALSIEINRGVQRKVRTEQEGSDAAARLFVLRVSLNATMT